MKVALPLPVAEWRALFSEGPATALVAKDDAVALLDRVLELEAREAALVARVTEAQQAETNWVRSSMVQERRAIRAEAEMQRLKDAIRALLEPDGLQGRGA